MKDAKAVVTETVIWAAGGTESLGLAVDTWRVRAYKRGKTLVELPRGDFEQIEREAIEALEASRMLSIDLRIAGKLGWG